MNEARTKSKVENIKGALMPYHPQKIYLFGSHAHGTSDKLSDVDLVIIKKTKKPFFDRLREIRRLLPPNLWGG